MASTCSTSVVPIPIASAPNAPCVAVCESPHTIVIPGWVRPSSGPMTWTIPWCGEPMPCSGIPNSRAVLLEAADLRERDLVGEGQAAIGRRDRVVDGGQRLARATHAEAAVAKAVEGLRARHLVHEVQVDAEHVGRAIGAGRDEVLVPDLVDDGLWGTHRSLDASRRVKPSPVVCSERPTLDTSPIVRPMTDPAPYDPREHSRVLLDGPDRAAARAMLKAIGFTDEDLSKPIIGVGTTWIETMPCNYNQRDLAVKVKEGIRAAGGTPMEFNTIAVSDGVSAWAPRA